MAKVLIITDYHGILHITPTATKNYYDSQNLKIKEKQFGISEPMEEKDAEAYVKKHEGRDPKFRTPAKVDAIITEKDDIISGQEAEIAKLKKLLEATKTTADTSKGNSAKTSSSTQPSAAEVVEKIKLATTIEEVGSLIVNDDRTTVLKAASDKVNELKEQQ